MMRTTIKFIVLLFGSYFALRLFLMPSTPTWSRHHSLETTSGMRAEKARAAVLGAFIADAATMGLHWIYDPAKIQSLLDEKRASSNPEFFEPPSCPFYDYTAGSLSPYGDEQYAVLRFLAEQGPMDAKNFAQYLYEYYKAYKGRLNHSCKTFLANFAAGKGWPRCGDPDDTQANCFVKVPPLVAYYAGSPALAAAVEQAVRVQQNNDLAVAVGLAAARILERVILGDTVAEAVDWSLGEEGLPTDMQALVRQAVNAKHLGNEELMERFGRSCALPGSFQAALALALAARGYRDAVRRNILAGGDNCSRSVLLGALLAAEGGMDSVPEEWRGKTSRFAEIDGLLDILRFVS